MKLKNLFTAVSISLLCILFCVSGCSTPDNTGSSSLPAITEDILPESGDGVIILTTGADGLKDTAGIYQICEEINQYIYKTIS